MTHSGRSGVAIQATPTSKAGSYCGWKKAVNIAFQRPHAGEAPHSGIVGCRVRDVAALSRHIEHPTPSQRLSSQ